MFCVLLLYSCGRGLIWNLNRGLTSYIPKHYRRLHLCGITYIHNCSTQPFSQDYDLVSHTTYVACVNFVHEWRNPQFKVIPERQIFFFKKLFIAILFTLRVFGREEVTVEMFFIFRLFGDA